MFVFLNVSQAFLHTLFSDDFQVTLVFPLLTSRLSLIEELSDSYHSMTLNLSPSLFLLPSFLLSISQHRLSTR